MMTMKEACAYKVQNRKARAAAHQRKVLKEIGPDAIIEGFTDKEYRRISIRGKGAGSKGRKASYSSIWKHYDLPRITATT